MSANNDSIQKTLLVAVLLCLVCSIVVSYAAVSLKPIQVKNKLLDKKKNILLSAGLMKKGESTDKIDEIFKLVTPRIVNLKTGKFATEAELKTLADAGYAVNGFNQRKLSKDSSFSVRLSSSEDKASIKRLEQFAAVFLVETNGVIEKIILPVHGYGLWSTLYGFIALEGDAETIAGLGFYAHTETPGLGGEVDNPAWKALWTGKKVHDAAGKVAIDVIKGSVDPKSAAAINQIDGLSGATLTSRGVGNLMQFWFGEQGFASFLTNLKKQGA